MIIKPLTIDTISEAAELYYSETKQQLDVDKIKEHITKNYPSLIVYDDHKVIGFVISGSFAPDILEIKNVFISKNMRARKIGSDLLKQFEYMAAESAKAIILVNSTLYLPIPGKRNPENFYINNGYSVIYETPETSVYIKSLEQLKK